jgi:hypothetical protein
MKIHTHLRSPLALALLCTPLLARAAPVLDPEDSRLLSLASVARVTAPAGEPLPELTEE